MNDSDSATEWEVDILGVPDGAAKLRPRWPTSGDVRFWGMVMSTAASVKLGLIAAPWHITCVSPERVLRVLAYLREQGAEVNGTAFRLGNVCGSVMEVEYG